jgi:2'-5' RNA ligase
MRTFIAIDISETMRESLSQIESHLKYSGADVKWVDKDNIHLTLKFLGEISEEKVKEITSILDAIGGRTKIFDIN